MFDLSSAEIGELDDFVSSNDPTGKSFFTDYSIWFKNDDRIEISSKFGFVANKHFFLKGAKMIKVEDRYNYNTILKLALN